MSNIAHITNGPAKPMNFLKSYWPGLLIALVFIIVGLTNYKGYGVSVDEMWQTEIGTVSYNYAFKGDSALRTYWERDHGAGYEMPLVIIQKQLGLSDTRDIYLSRHIITNIFFILCMLSGYFLVLKLFRNQFIACATLVMLIFNPRLYAHSFFNSKDIPALSVFLVALSVAYWTFEQRKLWQYLLLGAICGYGMSIRLMNVVLVAPLVFFILIDVFSNRKDKAVLKKQLWSLLLLIVGCALTVYIFWPTLWEDPFNSLRGAFESLSKFRWQGDVLLGGKLYNAEKLPWYYVPEWVFVTVPEVWLFLGIAGCVVLIVDFIRKPTEHFKNNEKRQRLLYLYCFLAPVITVIVLHAIMYDDWRHLFFIYPPFILLAAYGMFIVFKTKLKNVLKVAFVLQLGWVVYFVVQNYPHEYIYFNNTISHKPGELMKQYELDYWGLSYKQGLEWLLENTDDDSIYINKEHCSKVNKMILPADKRNRLIITEDEDKVEYFLENFRLYPLKYPESTAIYQIKVSNSVIHRITKLR